jgi:hypothetical protein
MNGGTHHPYQVGIAANHRYLDALAAAPLKGEGVAALDALCRPRTNRERRYARFSPFSQTDLALFRAAMAGEHAIQGFRNADLTRRLCPCPPADRARPTDNANASHGSSSNSAATVSLVKIPRARRYRVTRYGQVVMTAAIVLHDDRFADNHLAAGPNRDPVSRIAQILSGNVRSPEVRGSAMRPAWPVVSCPLASGL